MNIFKTAIPALILLGGAACSDTPQAQEKTQETVNVEKPVPVKAEKTKAEKPKLPDVTTTDLGNGIYMLIGQGGNIGVSNGADGMVVIDDQYARMAPKIQAALKDISDKPVRFLINTHYHGDHAGGNVEMHKHGADIIAHDNVRKRLTTPTINKVWNSTVEPMPEAAWPVITFSDNSTLYLNKQTIRLIHAPSAHTDGDSIVYFPEANVLHMGDNFFHNMLPYIDVDGGGSVDGMIAAQEKGLALANAETKIIPGHGPLATKADLQKFRDILVDMRGLIQTRIDAGENIDTILKNNPIEKYKEYASFIQPDLMAKIVYRSLSGG